MATEGNVPAGLDPTITKRDIVFTVEATNIDPMLKIATLNHNQQKWFTLACDEGEHLGGHGSAPPPLAYFSAAYAF
jgi:hypothetical protein